MVTGARCVLAIVALTVGAYLGSFAGVFVLDDVHEIADNRALDHLWPPWRPMFNGQRLPARPLPYLTFAIDRAVWGGFVPGYHLTNLLVHLVASLAVFEFVRLTLLSPRLRGGWGSRAVPIAAVIAGLWAVHPLQTQAVTYIYQRIESLAGMFCLLSLAAFARASATGWPQRTMVASAVACAAAMACKENAVVLPLLLLAYDWLFAPAESPSAWRADVRRRLGFHAACFATWIILAAVVLSQSQRYQEFNAARRSPLEYGLTQPGVILHYLRLAVLPVGQRFDYGGWPVVARPSVAQLPAYAAIMAAVYLTVLGTIRREPWAWLGLFFLATLAPTSSVMPVDALVAEHRMYLPLAAVVATIVITATAAGSWLSGMRPHARAWLVRAGVLAALVAAAVLATLTGERNRLYASKEAIWSDVLRADPGNYRGLWQRAMVLQRAGRKQAAFEAADRALDGKPGGDVFARLAAQYHFAGDLAEAERLLRHALRRQRAALPADDPAVLSATGTLATFLWLTGRPQEAAGLSDDTVADMRRILGTDNVTTLRAEQFVAEGLALRGEHAAAERLARDVLERARRSKGEADDATVTAAIGVARIVDAAGRTADARRVVESVLADLEASGPGASAQRQRLETVRARCLDKERLGRDNRQRGAAAGLRPDSP